MIRFWMPHERRYNCWHVKDFTAPGLRRVVAHHLATGASMLEYLPMVPPVLIDWFSHAWRSLLEPETLRDASPS